MSQNILIFILFALLLLLIFMLRYRTIKTWYTKAPFQEAEKRLVDSISEAGWVLLSMHDIQARLINAGFDMKRIAVYEICRPDYAAAVLREDANKKFSALMPCRISLFELEDGTTGISMLNAGLMSTFFGGVVLRVMSKAARESEQIIHKTIKQTINE
jgi:uncharacterized protein (DUF302 family)